MPLRAGTAASVALLLLAPWRSTSAQNTPAVCGGANDGVCDERLFAENGLQEGCAPGTDRADCVPLDSASGGTLLATLSGSAVQCAAPSEEQYVRCCSSIALPGYVRSTDPTCGNHLWYSSQFSCADTSVACEHRSDGFCDEPGGFFTSAVSCWLGGDSQDCCEDLVPRWESSDPSGHAIDPTRVCCEGTPNNCAFDCADDDATVRLATAGQGPDGNGFSCADVLALGACSQLNANANGTGVCGCSCPMSCPYAEDGVCDEPGGFFESCLPGTDAADCCYDGQPRDRPEDPQGNRIDGDGVCCDGTCARCTSTGDGVCDEGTSCPPGSDTADCCTELGGQPLLNDATGRPIDRASVCCSPNIPACVGQRSLESAENICGADSARLCTMAELQCTAAAPQQCEGTAEGAEMFWTSESCDLCDADSRVGCSLTGGARSGNGQCNPECNLPECGWDGGDCNPGTVQVGAASPGYPKPGTFSVRFKLV